MIVKYVRERGYEGEGKDPYLTLGNEYIVFQISYHTTGGFHFSLPCDSEDDPIFLEASFFDIVDARVPEDFIFKFSEGGYACLQPKEFGGDFWDLYHDNNSGEETVADVVKSILNNGDKEVYKTFAGVVERIKQFHGWPVEKDDYTLPYAKQLSANRFVFEIKQLIDDVKLNKWDYQKLSDVMADLIAKIKPEENPLHTRVLDAWAVIFNQSLDTPSDKLSSEHMKVVEEILNK